MSALWLFREVKGPRSLSRVVYNKEGVIARIPGGLGQSRGQLHHQWWSRSVKGLNSASKVSTKEKRLKSASLVV